MEVETVDHEHSRVDDENNDCTCSQCQVIDLENHLVQ